MGISQITTEWELLRNLCTIKLIHFQEKVAYTVVEKQPIKIKLKEHYYFEKKITCPVVEQHVEY